MTSVELRPATDDNATAAAPLIVNGLTVRSREKVNLRKWKYLLVLPDFMVLPVIAGLSMRRLLRYLDAKGRRSTH